MDILIQLKNDHPGYSYERAPWALVTEVGPFQLFLYRNIGHIQSVVNRLFLSLFKRSRILIETIKEHRGLAAMIGLADGADFCILMQIPLYDTGMNLLREVGNYDRSR